MSINDQLEKLYLQYKHPGEQFVKCGVVNEMEYNASKPKVLFLMKEVNDPNQTSDWSLVEFIDRQGKRESTIYSTFKRVGEWSYGVQNNFPAYHDDVCLHRDANIISGLKKIAITNLKKSGGRGFSERDEILEHAKKYRDLWVEEIELIQPDIIICAGTYVIVKEVLGFDNKVTANGANYGDALGMRFIDFYHPAYQVSSKMLYSYLKDTMRSLGIN